MRAVSASTCAEQLGSAQTETARPWLRALRATRCLPVGDVGPVLLCALALLAAIFARLGVSGCGCRRSRRGLVTAHLLELRVAHALGSAPQRIGQGGTVSFDLTQCRITASLSLHDHPVDAFDVIQCYM
jgi:hypothetical protein